MFLKGLNHWFIFSKNVNKLKLFYSFIKVISETTQVKFLKQRTNSGIDQGGVAAFEFLEK